jgi:hypothetical protein
MRRGALRLWQPRSPRIVCWLRAPFTTAAKLAHRAGPDPTIVRALARAHEWRGWLEQDEVHFYRDIANKAEVDSSYVRLVLLLAFIDPQLTRELLDGRRGVSGGLMELLRRGIPDWQQQRAYFRTQAA